MLEDDLRGFLMAATDYFQKAMGSGLGVWERWYKNTLAAYRIRLQTLISELVHASLEEAFFPLIDPFRFGGPSAGHDHLALWLSQVLKCHCAPMRDQWIDDTVNEIRNGFQTEDPVLLVMGLDNLLGVLEAMKLDVANHQIRSLRPLVTEDTVHFEQKFFMNRIFRVVKIDAKFPHEDAHQRISLATTIPLFEIDSVNAIGKLSAISSSKQHPVLPLALPSDEHIDRRGTEDV